MSGIRQIWAIFALVVCAALVGCGGTDQFGSHGQTSGNSSVVLAMTDSPPSNVTILSAEATLTGATLAPGNVSLFSGSTNVELTRLQTDVAYLTTAANIPAGTYTSVTLTFANLSVTIENDTASAIGSCAVGAVCTLTPSATSMSATVPLTSFTLAASSTTGLLIDIDLNTLLNSSLAADFSAGASVTSFTPGGTNAPPVGAEDVVGHVANLNVSSGTFTLTNAQTSYALKVNGSSTFFQFPSGPSCSSPGIACLQNNQIVSVDIAILSDGSIAARNIVFEDADSSDAEVEGEITGTNASSQQFSLVVHTISASGTSVAVGAPVTVQYSNSTAFDVDFLHIDNLQETTTSFASFFTGPADLVVGQEVSIRRNSSSSGSTVVADRVRLRSTRVSAIVQSVGSPNIVLGANSSLPSIFFDQGVTLIQAQTSVAPPTIYFEIGASINASTNITNQLVAVRGPLFNTGGTNRTLLTTKVVLK